MYLFRSLDDIDCVVVATSLGDLRTYKISIEGVWLKGRMYC